MALSLLLSGLALAPYVQAQAYDAVERDEDAFSYIQPLDTTILTQYGSSPAVLPSRKIQSIATNELSITHLQQTQPDMEVGKLPWLARKRL
jgi:beta-glucosidase